MYIHMTLTMTLGNHNVVINVHKRRNHGKRSIQVTKRTKLDFHIYTFMYNSCSNNCGRRYTTLLTHGSLFTVVKT